MKMGGKSNKRLVRWPRRADLYFHFCFVEISSLPDECELHALQFLHQRRGLIQLIQRNVAYFPSSLHNALPLELRPECVQRSPAHVRAPCNLALAEVLQPVLEQEVHYAEERPVAEEFQQQRAFLFLRHI